MRRTLRSWLWRVPLEEEVGDELAFHVEMRTRELIAGGMAPDAARREALRRVGNLRRVAKACVDIGRKRDREMRLVQWFQELTSDVRFAWRQLRAAPGFALVAALTLALGIGANSAIFALADATVLRPLPFPNPDRLVLIDEWGPQQGGRSRIELLNLDEWERQSRTFESLTALWIPASGGGPTLIGPDGTPEMVSAQQVTPRFFDVFGVRPILGRTFRPDDAVEQPDAIVISETFWRQRLDADPSVVGRAIPFEGGPLTVVGVVPAGFRFGPGANQEGVSNTRAARLWRLLPRPTAAAAGAGRGQCGVCRLLRVVGRVKPDVSHQAAQADLTAIADRLAAEHGTPLPRRVVLTPLHDELIAPDLQVTALLLLGVVGFVLLMCCANLANLLLARTAMRTRELALRSALGAGRRRIVRQLLTESVVLAALGGAAGIGVCALIVAATPLLVPDRLIPEAVTLALNGRVLAFCAASAVLVGVLFGIVPAWEATGRSLTEVIASESRTSTGGNRLRSVVVAAEIAAAVLVLCGAGVLLRTLLALDAVDEGYRANPAQVLTADFDLPDERYPDDAARVRFYTDVEQELMALPGVSRAGWATTLPLGNSQLGGNAFEIVGDPPPPADATPGGDIQIVSTSYFSAVDLPVALGRTFSNDDRSGGEAVCLVNEAFVRRYLAGRNPLGIRIALRGAAGRTGPRTIVGVARQVKERPDETEDFVQIYLPMAQLPWAEAYLLVRSDAQDGATLAASVRQAVARVDRTLPMRNIVTLQTVARANTAPHRFRAVLVGAFAALGLGLAVVGVFGVLAYSVQQRVREFGVRLALGATSRDVMTLVLGSGARLVAIGVGAGLATAALLARGLSGFLFGVQPLDALSFASAALLLVVTAAIAMIVPAWRAARVDPIDALRNL